MVGAMVNSPYYDAIGLLALCDAIDNIEGIPFKPAGSVKLLSSSTTGQRLAVSLPGPYPPVSVPVTSKGGFNPHPYLNHVPVTATGSTRGTLPYVQAQRAAFSQLAPNQRPDVRSAGTLTSGPAAGSAPAAARGTSGTPGAFQTSTGAAAANIGTIRPTQQSAQQYGTSQHSSQSPAASQNRGYRVEECPICGREFKGPKASTHRQQHIRRLHPDNYTPKRGGKKKHPI